MFCPLLLAGSSRSGAKKSVKKLSAVVWPEMSLSGRGKAGATHFLFLYLQQGGRRAAIVSCVRRFFMLMNRLIGSRTGLSYGMSWPRYWGEHQTRDLENSIRVLLMTLLAPIILVLRGGMVRWHRLGGSFDIFTGTFLCSQASDLLWKFAFSIKSSSWRVIMMEPPLPAMQKWNQNI